MPDTLLVNEVEKGLFMVFWELRETPKLSEHQLVTKSAPFSDAGGNMKFLLSFRLHPIDLEVTLHVTLCDYKERDNLEIFAFHQGELQMGVLVNDKCEFTWNLKPSPKSLDPVTQYQTWYPDNTCNFQIMFRQWHELRKQIPQNNSLVTNLSKMLESESHADIQFVVKGQKLAAHSAIIAASSPVFSAMLEEGKFKEAQTRIIEIEDTEFNVFRQLLNYLYTGEAPKMKKPKITEPLFIAADKYQVSQLKKECEACLISNLTVENAIHHLALAHLLSAPKLKEAAFDSLVEHRHKVWKRTEWKEFNKSYPELFYEACDRMVNESDDDSDEEEIDGDENE